jgi:hypothetical protein
MHDEAVLYPIMLLERVEKLKHIGLTFTGSSEKAMRGIFMAIKLDRCCNITQGTNSLFMRLG